MHKFVMMHWQSKIRFIIHKHFTSSSYLSPPWSPSMTGRWIVLCHHSLSVKGFSFKKERRDHKSFKEFWIGVPKIRKRIWKTLRTKNINLIKSSPPLHKYTEQGFKTQNTEIFSSSD